MSLSQYILDAREQYRLEVRERNTWLARLRWYYLIILAAVTIVGSILTNTNISRNIKVALIATISGLTINLVLWGLTKPKNRSLFYYQAIAVTQLVLDVSLATIIIYLQNGLGSRATILFAIPIVGAGLLLSQGFAYIAALFTTIGYAIAVVIYRYNNPSAYEMHEVTLPIVFYAAVFFMIAVIVSAFRSRAASDEREKSYAELLALLRHQLYHPSGVVAAIVDMLEHGENYPSWPDKDKAYLHQLKRENKRLHSMVANLLESVTDHDEKLTKPKVFDIVKLLNDEAVSCATGAKRIADLQTQLPNKVIEVEGNPDQLSTAIDNIIENAFRYTEKGTPVIVSATEENYKITVSIHDKGPGMSEEEQRAIFKLFSKMQSRVSGKPEVMYDTGLGLYVSKLIIERHKGKLEVSSTAEYGTNITITLYRRLV